MWGQVLTVSSGTIGSTSGQKEPQGGRLRFRKGLGRLAGIVLCNSLFEFLSLGLFRFWSRTRLRRFYWNQALIDGTPLEYDGRGVELLSGFLRVLAILLLPGAIIFIAAIAAGGPLMLLGPADFAFMLALLPLIPLGLYRARGYRVSRTFWRGIGCHQDGSDWHYARLWTVWLLVCVATLGLAIPWRNVATQRYRITHTLYGDMRFGFTGQGRELIAAWIVPWLCGIGATGYALASFLPANGLAVIEALPPVEWAFGLGLAFVVLFIRYRTVEFRYFARHTTLGQLRFRSHLRSPAVISLLLPHLAGATVLIAVNVRLMLVLAETFRLSRSAPVTADGLLFVLLLLISVLVLTMLVSMSYNLLVRYGLLRLACRSLEVENLAALADTAPAQKPRPRRGEGFAEAFDMGAM